jgi:predicted DNA-binding transcriptional regulator AlpA
MNNKKYVKAKQLSVYTSIPIKTIYDWSSTGRLPVIRIGRSLLYDLKDIERVMDSLKHNNNQVDKITNKIVGDIFNNDI